MSRAQHSYLCLLAGAGCWNMIRPQLHWQFFWKRCSRVCVSEHMHVCVGGVPHTLLFSSESWEEGMSASQLSSAERANRERRGSSLLRLRSHPPICSSGAECACMCVYALSRGWKEGHTMVLPLALTHFVLSCIFNSSNAKLSVVLFGGTLLKSVTVPHPLVCGDNGV